MQGTSSWGLPVLQIISTTCTTDPVGFSTAPAKSSLCSLKVVTISPRFHSPGIHTSKRCLETKSKSLKTVCSLQVRRETSSGGVRIGFWEVNSSSKLLVSVGSLNVGTKGGFSLLASKASQSSPCKKRKATGQIDTRIIYEM